MTLPTIDHSTIGTIIRWLFHPQYKSTCRETLAQAVADDESDIGHWHAGIILHQLCPHLDISKTYRILLTMDEAGVRELLETEAAIASVVESGK